MDVRCDLCGALMTLTKIFSGKKSNQRTERYTCTDKSCNNEKTIAPAMEPKHIYKEMSLKRYIDKRKILAKHFKE